MTYLVACLAVLLVVALSSYVASRGAARRGGLPAGQVLYSDTGSPVGRIGSIVKDARGVRQEKPLVSKRYGLTGRPDYLVRTREGVVPVEIKSARCPAGGRAYDSHVMQLAAYCLLVEDVLGATVPYGVIQYSDCEVTVDYTQEMREELTALLDEMRGAALAEEVHRSHDEVRRCSGCSMNAVCTESLARA